MNLLGGAYADSDSDDETKPATVPAPAPAAASSSAPAPKRKNKRKGLDLSKLPIKRKVNMDEIFKPEKKEEEVDLGKAPLQAQALAAKRNALAQQAARAADDDTVLGALPQPGAHSAPAASSSSALPSIKSSNNPMEKQEEEKGPQMITSLNFTEEVSDGEEDDGNMFTLDSKEIEEESNEVEEDNTDAAGPIMPSDWSTEAIEAQYEQPDNFAGLSKDTLLSEAEKRALAMGSNVMDFNPTELRDDDWRRKQLAAELPGRPKHEKRVIKTKQYSVEDQGRITGGVTMNQKRKHQIGWLAQSYADASYDLAQKEMDGAGKKRATHQKYGW